MKKILATGLLVGLTIILFSGFTNAGSQFDIPKNETFDSIGYYNKIEKSEKGFNEYKQEKEKKNKELVQAKVEDILTTITFKKAITQDDLRHFIANNKIDKIKQVQGRFVTSDGERITLATQYDNDQYMEEEIKGILEKMGNSATFKGYTDIAVTIDYTSLVSIENEDFVYLADTSADSYFTKEKDKEHPHPLTWDLENLSNK